MKPTSSLQLKRRIVLMLMAGALIAACGAGDPATADDQKITTITAETLQKRLQASSQKPLVVDVREPSEFEAGHIEGAVLAPLGRVEDELKNVDKNRDIVLVCRSGRRSAKAYATLAGRGYTTLANMEGGMLAWEKLGYPTVKK